ncbi:MAG: AAA family ATPase [Actinomycetota bacterium]|nr:AAA family ATPase [Actinomycetota bacterium]
MTDPHLIVIRGNSASGKSTLALRLQHALGPGTANIGQDHFRRIVLREHDVPGGTNIGFIDSSARYCLAAGWNVIVEGILIASHYGDMLRALVSSHQGPTHLYYIRVDLEETVRRHQARPLAAKVPSAKLYEWFHADDLLGLPGEIVIDGAAPLDVVQESILDDIGSVPMVAGSDGARFL